MLAVTLFTAIITLMPFIAFMPLITGLLADDFRASRVSQEATQRSVWRAQQASYVIIIALFIASVAPSIPDYPAVANLTQALPRCGVNFNDLVQSLYGSIVGSVAIPARGPAPGISTFPKPSTRPKYSF